MHYTIHTDGGARGNPGPAGAGVVIESEGKKIELKKFLNIKTNNQAEYEALIFALEHIVNLFSSDQGVVSVFCFLDSELVVRQLNGQYRVKEPNLKLLFSRAKALAANFAEIKFNHIPRSENKEADQLVNQAINENSL